VGDVTLVAFGEEERVTPESNLQGVDQPVVEDVSAKLAKRMPGMEEAIFRGGWSGLFTTTPDWHPILDAVPGIDGLYVAVGFSGHGFKLSPMIGIAMAEMVLEKDAKSIDVSALGLNRFRDGTTFRSRYRMNVLA
jgi:sarcosine oxidase subunit beta